MMQKTITHKDWESLEFIWDTEYKPFGWRIKSGIERKWSWLQFGYIYSMTLELGKVETITSHTPIIERINNQSETNTQKQVFSYRSDGGVFYKKEFWVDPTHFNPDEEFHKWMVGKNKKT